MDQVEKANYVESERTGYVEWLDGLRGLAILLVLVDHFLPNIYLCRIGWIGVNLFFILSGYLITGRLFHHLEEGGGKFYFRNFYGRRFLRIFPLYYACLFVFFGVFPLFFSRYFVHFGELYREQWWYWTYLSNWRIVIYGFPGNSILVFLWSLAVEEQFYLFWPLLFRCTSRVNRKAIVLFLWLVSIVVRILMQQPGQVYFSTLTAAEPLLMGSLLCLYEKEGKIPLSGKVTALLVSTVTAVLAYIFLRHPDLTYWNGELMRWGYTCINILLAFLLYKLVAGGTGVIWMRRIFSGKWIVWLGRYSYGIYMFNWFIVQMLVTKWFALLTGRGIGDGAALFLSNVAGIVVLLIISYLSYRYFESKFLRLKKYFI